MEYKKYFKKILESYFLNIKNDINKELFDLDERIKVLEKDKKEKNIKVKNTKK